MPGQSSLAAQAEEAAGRLQVQQAKADPTSSSGKKRKKAGLGRPCSSRDFDLTGDDEPVAKTIEEIINTADQYLSDEDRVRKWFTNYPYTIH